jgi:autotransporter-associated beta strand protein
LNASGAPTFAQGITLNSGSKLSARQAATLSNVTLPASGSVILNNDDVATSALTLSSANALSGALTVQVGGGATPGTVTLSGILSGSGGSLVKNGSGQLVIKGVIQNLIPIPNTFTGGVTIKNGTLESAATQTTLGTGTVTMGGTGSTGATFITGQNNSNPFVINAPDSGSVVIGANGNGSGFTMSGAVTLNGNLTFQTFDNPVPIAPLTTKASTSLTGGITGTGNLLLNNLGLAANTISITTATVNHTGSITLQGTGTGATTISGVIGANVTGITQNSATSRLDLSGANTYAGNLTVNAGLVRLSNAPDPLNANTGNDASTVTIAATGATLDLTYTGTDKVDKLVIGSTQQANGVYGKVGSVSPVIGISQITGDGTLTVGTESGPGPLHHFTITPIGGTQTVGTAITGITITAKDASDNTATGFTGTVSFSGTGGFTGTSSTFSLGVLSGVSVTPANAGSGLTLIVTEGVAGPTGTATITTIQTQYAAWAGGALFDADTNGDGVKNGLAWILGAANPNASALGLLPAVSTSGGNMLFTFKRNQASINASTALTIDVGTTLASWPNAYNVGTDTAGSTEGVAIVKNSPGAGTDTVTLTVTRAPDAKKFARLKATQNVQVP